MELSTRLRVSDACYQAIGKNIWILSGEILVKDLSFLIARHFVYWRS